MTTVEEIKNELPLKIQRDIYENMENFRVNPSNGNRYFEAVIALVEEQLTTLETKVRADERQKVLEEVEKLINKRCFLEVIGSKQHSICDADELRTKLNQLKET